MAKIRDKFWEFYFCDKNNVCLVNMFQINTVVIEIMKSLNKSLLNVDQNFWKKKIGKPSSPGPLSAPSSKVAHLITSSENGASRAVRSTHGLFAKRVSQSYLKREDLLVPN